MIDYSTGRLIKPGYRYRTGVICPHCKQLIVSEHRHDMRFCFCGYCFVDGGQDYLRYGWGGPGHEDLGPPKPARKRVYDKRS
jgi:hypothetical protein